jgi:hypothetical protein
MDSEVTQDNDQPPREQEIPPLTEDVGTQLELQSAVEEVPSVHYHDNLNSSLTSGIWDTHPEGRSELRVSRMIMSLIFIQ